MTTLVIATRYQIGRADALRKALPDDEILVVDPAGPFAGAERADALVGGNSAESATALLDAAPRARWYQTVAAGVEHILDLFAARPDVVLTNNSGAYDVPIAEHVLALVFAAAKHLPEYERAKAAGEWRRELPHTELRGATLVVFGMGSIGGEAARLGAALGMRVIGVRRQGGPLPALRAQRPLPLGVERALSPDRLGDAVAEADYLAICAPLTPETRGAVSRAVLARMKPSAWIVNIARGAIVDEAALTEALRDGRLGGAALDVFATEPLPASSELWKLPNVIITPHAASSSVGVGPRTIELIAENMRRFKAGEPLLNRVDLKAGY